MTQNQQRRGKWNRQGEEGYPAKRLREEHYEHSECVQCMGMRGENNRLANVEYIGDLALWTENGTKDSLKGIQERMRKWTEEVEKESKGLRQKARRK
jgi:hypothetical protein